ncbi:hypothetical protein [Floridanema evergladense]|uniref:Uncharacterized protein n=1 Tax=Floridaenema evergladense BLCC-F167 TaxID=3153639 RepID=A0ABV4WF54_9CYAN
MSRLTDRAGKILRAEVEKCVGKDTLLQVQRDIILKRLNRLREQDGNLASYEELRNTISDVFPNFSDKVLRKAAKANLPPGAWSKIKWVVGIAGVSAGTVWLLNLPYPMIRWPVARTAPILLLPSYMKMDYDYRQAIVLVEQADQLVNRATSQADLVLGAQKVKQAQKHLDDLPVWFLGYQPQYRFWFGWNFTLDEFRSARANVGRMEAKREIEYLLANTSGRSDRNQIVSKIQSIIDKLQQVKTGTTAYQEAQQLLLSAQKKLKEIEQSSFGS